MERNQNLVLNIPSDGIEEEVIRGFELSKEGYQERLKNYLATFLKDTPVGKVLVNVCYKRSVVPSDVADTYLYNILRDENGYPLLDEKGNLQKEISPELTQTELNRGFREMQKRNIDIIGMAVEEIKRYGAKAWFSVRMNDHHFPNDPGFNSSLSYERAEELGVNGGRRNLDYTKAPVSNYYRNYIEEICRNYDVDGIELDFLRSCPVMGEVTEENKNLLTEYVAAVSAIVRKIGKEKGKEMGVSVRVYPTEEMNLDYGIDAARWVAEGFVDTITLENWYIPTHFNIPVERWRASVDALNVKRRAYTLLCGTDWAVQCDLTMYSGMAMWISLEQFRGFVSASLSRGADGIYIFNHFNAEDTCHQFPNMGSYSYYIDEAGNETKKHVLREKICAANSLAEAETGKRCYVKTYAPDSESPYPIHIKEGKFFETEINTGKKLPEKYWNILIGIEETKSEIPVFVEVNGKRTKKLPDVPKKKGCHFRVTDEAYPLVNHISETAPRVMRFGAELSSVTSMFNQIKILSSGSEETQIKWLEIEAE